MPNPSLVCRICSKRISATLEGESKALIAQVATDNGIDPAWLLSRWHPLCEFCRQNIERAHGPKAKPAAEPPAEPAS